MHSHDTLSQYQTLSQLLSSSSKILGLLLLLGLTSPLFAQQHSGELGPGDNKLSDGEYYDTYYIDVEAGQRIIVTLRSTAFDTYLLLTPPEGSATQNDDYEDSKQLSKIEMVADQSGEWRVLATSYAKDETGAYDLNIMIGGGDGVTQQTYSDQLQNGDNKLNSGEYYDTYYFEAVAGQEITASVRSDNFDTYLMVKDPSGESTENNDFEGSSSHSQVSLTAGESGEWRLLITSNAPDETGVYIAQLELGGSSNTVAQTNSAGGITENYSGVLENGDSKLNGGEFYDIFYMNLTAGQNFYAELRATQFDTYLIAQSPSGSNSTNDDFENSKNKSVVEVEVDETGEWKIYVTSYEAGESGSYNLDVRTSNMQSASNPTNTAAGGTRYESGSLASGDETLTSGEYKDYYEYEGLAGQFITVDLRSSEFDPYLIFKSPSGEQFDNDDHEGDATRSQVAMELTESGTWGITVTSYKSDESGDYTLSINNETAGATSSASRTETGTLAAGDATLSDGEFIDEYTFEGRSGQHVHIDLSSTEFDTYLIVKPPRGDGKIDNDDAEGFPGHSIIDFDLTESGTYTIAVTSYQSGESGNYTMDIAISDQVAQETSQRDVSTISLGSSEVGRLQTGDGTLSTGELRDIFVFNGSAGETVSIELSSSDFDTYLMLRTPDDESIDNDDFEGDRNLSRVDLTLKTTGRYRIIATSYEAGESGRYNVTLNQGNSSSTSIASGNAYNTNASRGSAGQIYGLFVGISDYGGRANNLAYTAEDAIHTRDALIRGASMPAGNAITLTDAEATKANFQQAIRTLAGRMSDNDQFVLFYSGHGSRYDRATFQQADPDAIDESIELYDDYILDDDMNELLSVVPAGTQLIVFDACFSGGFAKDIISQPGRMGLFSSEEDVTSSVAAKFRAGGYLAQFFADAVGERLADADSDGGISALELSHYIGERYRSDVKSFVAVPSANFTRTTTDSDDFVRTSRELGYQRLIVDRGSIGPYFNLF